MTGTVAATVGASEFSGRVVVVTGGGGGMGRATCRAFGAAGAAVVVADLDDERGNETAALLREDGATAIFVRTDVSRPEDVQAMVDHALEAFGGLDHAVNAAAIEFENTLLQDATDADYDRMMDVNVRSVFLCMRAQVRAMLDHGRGGTIVAIASTSAYRPQPRTPLYTASKHAVLGFVRAVGTDYARHGIRVNAIAPGAIDTPMLRAALERRGGDPTRAVAQLSPAGRYGLPDEIARAALWLSSSASSFVVGHALAVDGGMLAR